MDFPFCACNAEIAEEDLQAQFRHKLSMRNGKNRNESGKVIAFLRRWLGGGVNSKLKSLASGGFNSLPGHQSHSTSILYPSLLIGYIAPIFF